MKSRVRVFLLILVFISLLTVSFLAYLRPDFMLDLATRVWLCF
jgi:hypothetical protein